MFCPVLKLVQFWGAQVVHIVVSGQEEPVGTTRASVTEHGAGVRARKQYVHVFVYKPARDEHVQLRFMDVCRNNVIKYHRICFWVVILA